MVYVVTGCALALLLMLRALAKHMKAKKTRAPAFEATVPHGANITSFICATCGKRGMALHYVGGWWCLPAGWFYRPEDTTTNAPPAEVCSVDCAAAHAARTRDSIHPPRH